MSLPRPQRRATGITRTPPLAELLGASRFRLGPHTTRVGANLIAHGGEADDAAPAWIGADLPPHNAPSVSLGAARGTLGPHSFGFLDNHRGVAPLSAPLPQRPRVGSIALVCGRREAMVDVGPLVTARDLGVSWIISVGDGDPAEVLRFLAADAATRAVLLAPGEGAQPDAIRAASDKPVAVLGGDPLLRAAVRRAGGLATDDLEAWLAFGALIEVMPPGASTTPRRPIAVVAGGGGAAQIAALARAAALDLPIITVDDDDPEEMEQAIAEATAGADLVLRVGLGAPAAGSLIPSLLLDPGAPDRTRALLAALGARLAPPPAPIPRVRADRARAQAILDESGAALGDHDSKRVLHTYGAKVSRQAPASSPTAALRVAQQLGFPVDVVAEAETRRAASPPDLKRAAGVLLDAASFVIVREAFPPTPRAALTVRQEGTLGLVARAGNERALLPLDRPDAIHLAGTISPSGEVNRLLVDLLARATTAALELELELDLEIYCGDEPAIVAATGRKLK